MTDAERDRPEQPEGAAAPELTPAVQEFLRRPLHAVLATYNPEASGLSQSVVWFHLDDDSTAPTTLWVSCRPESVKARHVRVNPEVSLLVLAPHGGAYVRVEGTATVHEIMTEEMRATLARPYRGPETEFWLAENPRETPNALLRIHPTRVIARGLGTFDTS